PPAGFRRLAPGRAVRLRHGPVVRVDDVETDDAGNVTKLKCHAFLDDMGAAPEGVKVWSTVHWVSRSEGVPMTARLYEPLFSVPDPEADGADFMDHFDPLSLVEASGLVEPSVVS